MSVWTTVRLRKSTAELLRVCSGYGESYDDTVKRVFLVEKERKFAINHWYRAEVDEACTGGVYPSKNVEGT